MTNRISLFLLLLCASFTQVAAEVRLPQLFQSGMVLQREKPIAVWGWATPGEAVSVTLGKKSASAVAGADGKWLVSLPAMKAGGPYEMTVGDKKLSDVWVGDVWLCSGQSNMETTIERVYPQYPDEIDQDANDRVRLFHVQYDTDANGPKSDLRPTSWRKLDKQSAWRFSAIGYFLGKQLQQQTGVAQGIIESAWGGTPIEAWIAPDSIAKHYPVYHRQTMLYQNSEYIEAQQKANQIAGQLWQQVLDQSDPGAVKAQDGKMLWTTAGLDETGWGSVDQYNLPGIFPGRREFVGSLWLRQHITIDSSHAGKACMLQLGTLFDCDYTFVNGKQVGNTGYQYPPRRYQVPEGLLHEGDNVIAVRFISKYGVPYFYKEKKYRLLFSDGSELPIGTQWLYKVGVEMPKAQGASLDVHYKPEVLFNGMINPIAPLSISGVIWFQGESNTGKAYEYAPMLRLMMANWREAFRQPDLPFVIIQLANYMEPVMQPQNTGWSQLREAQRVVAAEDPRAELAVTIDLGETVDIHPLRKKEVAQRVALCLDRLVYGKKVQLSPAVVSAALEGTTVMLTLDQPMRMEPQLKYFEVAGPDGRFQNAEAVVKDGNRIAVQSNVSQPRRVRYAWKDNPLGVNVYSQSGLPLAPFEMELP